MNIKALLITLALTLSGCSESEPPIKIESYDKTNPYNSSVKSVVVKITSKTDEVVIEDVITNRGNCKIFPTFKKRLPSKLTFGNSVEIRFAAPCTAAQVDVVTDQGDWSVSYE